MKNNVALKIAASTLIFGVTMVGCKPAAEAYRPATYSAKAPKADKEAGKLYARAQAAVQEGKLTDALSLTERAVELSPLDAGYRMLLGDLYLKSGRFQSAETSFSDVLSLDPDNARASLSLALAQIALGKRDSATAHLDRLSATAAPADLGLAYALAGHAQRAVEMLEPAARAADANGRVRQNLALAYALAGDWQKARTTAAQDVSPADLDGRIRQWATFSQPQATWDQVASLLGVTPVEDSGQPVRLALAAPAEDSTRFAEAEAVIPPAEEAVVEVAYAAAEPVAIPAPPAPPVEFQSAEAAAEQALAEVEYAEAVQTLVDAKPVLVRASAPIAEAVVPAFNPLKKAPRIAGKAEKAAERREQARGLGRFVVQIGAFRTATQVEEAWARAYVRYPVAEHEPLSTKVTIARKGTFHRLSVAGFGTHGEAARLCGSIRRKGGNCFVRATAGDAPVQWASRYARSA